MLLKGLNFTLHWKAKLSWMLTRALNCKTLFLDGQGQNFNVILSFFPQQLSLLHQKPVAVNLSECQPFRYSLVRSMCR
jgi:hypothetical protein